MGRGIGATFGNSTADLLTTNYKNSGSGQLMTYAARVFINGYGGGNLGRIFNKGTGQLLLFVNNSNAPFQCVRFNRNDNGSQLGLWQTVAGSVLAGQEYHICVTHDASAGIATTPHIYINGVDQALTTNTATSNPADNTTPFEIGNRVSDSARVFDGIIQDVGIWEGVVLTPSQVIALFRGVPVSEIEPKFLVVDLPFRGSSRNTIYDYAQKNIISVVGTKNYASNIESQSTQSRLFKNYLNSLIPTAGVGTQNITLTAIAPTAAFGTMQLNMNIVLSGIGSTNAFGTMTVGPVIQLTGIPSTVAFGNMQLNMNISLSGIASTNVFGTMQLDRTIQLTGIAKTAVVGTPQVNMDIQLVGIAKTAAIGTMVLNGNTSSQNIQLIGIGPVSGVGVPSIRDPNLITLTGFKNLSSFGTMKLTLQGVPTNSQLDSNIPWEWIDTPEKYQLYSYFLNLINSIKAKDESVIYVSASPAGVVSAKPGTIALNLGGGAGNTLWVKQSALDSSGWFNVA